MPSDRKSIRRQWSLYLGIVEVYHLSIILDEIYLCENYTKHISPIRAMLHDISPQTSYNNLCSTTVKLNYDN